MLGIIHAAFSQTPYALEFDAQLVSEKKLKFDSIEDLLRHDNTLADPIHHLVITATGKDEASSCELFFYGEKEPHLSGIAVKVESNEQRWASSLAAEIEEQVERIRMPGVIYQLRQSVGFRNLWASLLIPLAVVGMTAGMFADLFKWSNVNEERRSLIQLAETAKTTDEKIDFLMKAQVSTLREKRGENLSAALTLPKVNARFAIGLLPVLVSLGLLWYLFRHCYPPAVFAWGDSGKQFQRLIERRKNIWSILVTVIILGFLVNLSSPVISAWLGM